MDEIPGIKRPSTISNQPSTVSPALDVLIIGAGAAGLAAARQLHGAGASVLVVEARHRMGGRILTHRAEANDLPLELGAEFVHGRPPAIFDLIEAAGLPAIEVSGDLVFSEGGALRTLDDFSQIVTRIDEQIDPRANVSYEQFLKSVRAPAFHKKIAKSYVEGFNAARAELISAASVAIADRAAKKIEGQKQFRLPSGYDSIIRELARVLPQGCIRFDHIVREVRWKQRKVEVRCLRAGEEIRFSAPVFDYDAAARASAHAVRRTRRNFFRSPADRKNRCARATPCWPRHEGDHAFSRAVLGRSTSSWRDRSFRIFALP